MFSSGNYGVAILCVVSFAYSGLFASLLIRQISSCYCVCVWIKPVQQRKSRKSKHRPLHFGLCFHNFSLCNGWTDFPTGYPSIPGVVGQGTLAILCTGNFSHTLPIASILCLLLSFRSWFQIWLAEWD